MRLGPRKSCARKKAVEKALQSVLTREQIAHAILLCDHEFATEPAFSATSFCQRLVETLPEIQLNAQARLALLRTVRQSAEELGVENVTSLVGVPRQFLQAVAPEDAPATEDREPNRYPLKIRT